MIRGSLSLFYFIFRDYEPTERLVLPNLKEFSFQCHSECDHIDDFLSYCSNASKLCIYVDDDSSDVPPSLNELERFPNLRSLTFIKNKNKNNSMSFWKKLTKLESLTLNSLKMTQRPLLDYITSACNLTDLHIYRSGLNFSHRVETEIEKLIDKRKTKKSLTIYMDSNKFEFYPRN